MGKVLIMSATSLALAHATHDQQLTSGQHMLLVESVVDDIETTAHPRAIPGEHYFLRLGAREALLGLQEKKLFTNPRDKAEYARGWVDGKRALKRIDELGARVTQAEVCGTCSGAGVIDTPLRRAGIGEMIIETGGEQYTCPECGGQGMLEVD